MSVFIILIYINYIGDHSIIKSPFEEFKSTQHHKSDTEIEDSDISSNDSESDTSSQCTKDNNNDKSLPNYPGILII